MNEVPNTIDWSAEFSVLTHEVNEVKQMLIRSQAAAINTKTVLNADEAAQYMGISIHHLYRLTSKAQIPYSKPSGKLMYFNRQSLDQWLLSNQTSTTNDIEFAATTYCLNSKGGK